MNEHVSPPNGVRQEILRKIPEMNECLGFMRITFGRPKLSNSRIYKPVNLDTGRILDFIPGKTTRANLWTCFSFPRSFAIPAEQTVDKEDPLGMCFSKKARITFVLLHFSLLS